MTGSPCKREKGGTERYPRFELREEHKTELKEAFDVFDNEGTGTIDIKDLRVALRALGSEPGKEEMKRLVGKYTRVVGPRKGSAGEEMVTEDKQSPWQQEEGDLLGSSTVYQQQHEVEDEEGSNKDGQEEGDGGPVREHGTLDFCEFLEIMLEKMTENCSRAEVEQAYHMVKGESGKVSREDLKAAAAELGEHIGEEELDEMMKEADTDGDGLISEEEFIGIVLNPDSASM
ncbi:calmodulin, putative [Perkinsus marinus ATCC 50983]|uniref:Calmodulin, putative n=1 Tax=Perkinsus marinus (strain ATCC 50983 / TXsc) TaxID=423536 RepID=C5KJX7_PERM5|nr:calmodulin, putative [Perkinsus marinus ATCC 50983]EER15235.1 calmodulin, putative [Perkinsus marinus ATCC 50983]|eukprot:XP_002783439.1 calmodulin, putative [Perkinsus marinus ATCC 50983]